MNEVKSRERRIEFPAFSHNPACVMYKQKRIQKSTCMTVQVLLNVQ